MIEVVAVGGYGESGKNMTAVKIGDDVIILDMGLHMPNYIKFTEEEEAELIKFQRKELIKVKAIPDDDLIDVWKKNVRAIIPSHAHLDHLGAIPYLASRYNAPIICTPFTSCVIKEILKDQKISIPNEIKSLNTNSLIKLSDDIKLEFINITHSTPQTVIVVLHTLEGCIVYANDFKLDNSPTLGKKPNYERLKKLGEHGVKLLITDSLYAYDDTKRASELIAKEMLKDVLLETNNKNKAVIVTTFSSHIARLKSIIEFGRQLKRRVVILGRSLAKYCYAAEVAGLYKFSKEAEIIKYSKKVGSMLERIQKEGKEKYLIITTGHQGERKSVLSKIARGELKFQLGSEDHIIFSCNVIPTPTNQKDRDYLECQLKKFGVRIFKGVHVSGHAAREDMRDLINMLQPEHLIPAHSEENVMEKFAQLAQEMGYKRDENLHLIKTGDKLKISLKC